MDTNNSQNPQPIIPANPTNTTDELTHTTEEMYKKNLELAEKNKTLSILRKIDEIIFSKVTDIRHISQQVANIVAIDAEFKGIAIYLVDKTDPVLNCVAISETPLMQKISSAINRPFYNSKIYLT